MLVLSWAFGRRWESPFSSSLLLGRGSCGLPPFWHRVWIRRARAWLVREDGAEDENEEDEKEDERRLHVTARRGVDANDQEEESDDGRPRLDGAPPSNLHELRRRLGRVGGLWTRMGREGGSEGEGERVKGWMEEGGRGCLRWCGFEFKCLGPWCGPALAIYLLFFGTKG